VAGVAKVCIASTQCLCGCCGNTALWDVGTDFFPYYSMWPLEGGPVQAFEFFPGCPRGSSGGASRLMIVMSICKV
jgi:hypothetical protein